VLLSILKIPTAKIFEPLLQPARYKGVYGGRGSGKSHFFGELLVETCQAERGISAVCIREAQKTLAQSSKRLIESKIAALGLGRQFRIFNDKIETPGDGVIIFRGMHIQTAKRFQTHAEQAITELTSALHLARDTSSEEELLAVTKLMGEIIARIDGLLHESIHGDYPELRELGKQRPAP